MNTSKLQEEFIDNEFWILTFGGAFQRAYVYVKNTTEKERKDFAKLKSAVIKLVEKQYHSTVISEIHIENIKALCVSNS